MIDYKRCLLILIALPLFASSSANALPQPALDLTELTKTADVIVVGQVTSVHDGGATIVQIAGQSIQARQSTLQLNVVRVLKGPMFASFSFRVVIVGGPFEYIQVPRSQFGMFFLRQGTGPIFEVANPYYPFLVAARGPVSTEGEPLERVTAELIHVLTSPETADEERISAIGILNKVLTPAVTKALAETAQGSNESVSLAAVTALLRRNETSALELAERALLGPRRHADPLIRRRLAYAIRDGVMASDAIPALTRMLGADDVEVRRSAASALRHIGTEAVIDSLARALQDSDREVRYQAVLGFASITEQEDWAPSLDLFAQHEQDYVTHWNDWLKVR